MKTLRAILNGIDLLNEKVGKIAAWSLILIIAIVGYDVLMRRVLKAPTEWGFDVTYMLWGFLFMMAAAWTMQTGGHISIDIVINCFSPKTRAFLDLIFYPLLCFPFLGVLLIKSIEFAAASWAIKETALSPWYPPLYPLKTVIPIGVFLLLLQCIAKFIRDLAFVIKGKSP